MDVTLIRGGMLVDSARAWRADVLLAEGKIAQVGQGLEAPAGARVVEAGGAYVMPGGVDPHTHMSLAAMGTVTTEGFFSGTSAAVAGGTTSILDFVTPARGEGLLEAFHARRPAAEEAVCDVGFHVCVTWWGEQVPVDMATLVRHHGVNSFKHFMAYKSSMMATDDILYKSFRAAAELGALCTVHAENGELVEALSRRLFDEGEVGPSAHPRSRPPYVEGEAANRAIQIARAAGAPLYIVHNSCVDSVQAITRARLSGQVVFGEALAQHLVIDDSVYRDPDWDRAAAHVMSPPFRAPEHQVALWAALQSRVLQTTATDHCCFSAEQKRAGARDFRKIPNGTGSVEDRMAVLWHHGVGTGRLTPSEFVAVTSTEAAKIFNLYPRKGSLMVGADADVVVWDPQRTRTLGVASSHQRWDRSLYEGVTLTGAPVHTFVRGALGYSEGTLRLAPGHGRYLARAGRAPCWRSGVSSLAPPLPGEGLVGGLGAPLDDIRDGPVASLHDPLVG